MRIRCDYTGCRVRGARPVWGGMSIPIVTISRKGEDRVRAGHPWIYRSDVERVEAASGDLVQVVNARARPLGHALFSDQSEITLRMIAHGPAAPSATFVRERIESAVRFRASLALDATAYRLVHGEADRLPSLIVDRYGDYLVVQALSQGIDRRLAEITAALVEVVHPRGILARNDPRVRLLGGLEQRSRCCTAKCRSGSRCARAPSTTKW